MSFIINWILRFGIIELFLVFFVSVNILTFVLYVMDKRRAAKSKWRINESLLIFFTLACGGIGAFLGIRFAKHKPNKRIFKFASMIGLIVALIPMIHIAHAFTLEAV